MATTYYFNINKNEDNVIISGNTNFNGVGTITLNGTTTGATLDLGNYYTIQESEDKFQLIGASADNTLYLTGVTADSIISALGYKPLSGSTLTSGDTLFDKKYLSISSAATINILLTGYTSINNKINSFYTSGQTDSKYKPISYVPAWGEVTGKPSFSTVATTNNYNDLFYKPVINDATLLIHGTLDDNRLSENVAFLNTTGLFNYYTVDESDANYKSSGYTPTWSEITKKPIFNNVAFTGDYYDLKNRPSLVPTATTVAVTTDATQLIYGTLNDFRLSSNVVLINSGQTLTNKILSGVTLINVSGLTKSSVGLSNVDNTSDLNKPISIAVQNVINNLQSGQTANSIKFNNYQVLGNYVSASTLNNLQVAGNYVSASTLNNYYTTGQTDSKYKSSAYTPSYNDLTNKPTFNNVAFTGDYYDLINRPTVTTTNTGTTVATVDASQLIYGTINDLRLSSNVVLINSAQTLTNKILSGVTLINVSGLTKSNIGLSNVDNTSDINKPISLAVQSGLTSNYNLITGNSLNISNLQTGLTAVNTNFNNYQLLGNYVSASTLSNYYTTGQTDSKYLPVISGISITNLQTNILSINNTISSLQTGLTNNINSVSGYTLSINNLQTGLTATNNNFSNYQPLGNYLSATTLNNYSTSTQNDTKYLAITSGATINNLQTGLTNNFNLITGNTSSITSLQTGLTATNAKFSNYQLLGNYVSASTLSNYYTSGQTDIRIKAIGDTLYAPIGSNTGSTQPVGNYVSASTLNNYYTTGQTDSKYLAISSGITISNLQTGLTAVNTNFNNYYTTNQTDSKYLPITSGGSIISIQTGLTATNAKFSNYQPVGNYVSASTLNNYYTKDQADSSFSTYISGITIDKVFANQFGSAFGGKVLLTGYTVDLTSYYTTGQTDSKYKAINYVPTWTEITNKPVFSTIATSGDYNDLINKPTGTVSGGTAVSYVSNLITGSIVSGTTNGSNKVFYISSTPSSNTESIYVNGLLQVKNIDYTITGSTFTLTSAPLANDIIRVAYIDQTALPYSANTDASKIISGTLSDARLSSNVVFQTGLTNYQPLGSYVSASTLNNYYTTAQSDTKYKSSAYTPSYAELTGKPFIPTAFNASAITGGTIVDSLLSSNIVFQSGLTNYYTSGQTDSKYLSITSAITINGLLSGQTANYNLITGNTASINSLQTGLTTTNAKFSSYQLAGNYVSANTLNNYYTTGQTDSKYKSSAYTPSYNDLTNKPTLATIATSGDYNDLTNKPAIPSMVSGEILSGTTNGSNKIFTISNVITINSDSIYTNGLLQIRGVDYAISGSTVTFTTAPLSGDIIQGTYTKYTSGQSSTGSTLDFSQFVNYLKTLPGYVAGGNVVLTSNFTWATISGGTIVSTPPVVAGSDTRSAIDPATPIPNLTYNAPITLLSGMADPDGVIRVSGNYRSDDPNVAAIGLNCGATPVEISNFNIVHAGVGIGAGTDCNVTIYNGRLYGSNPVLDGNARERSISLYRPTKVNIHHVSYQSAGGLYIDHWNGGDNGMCSITNIKSRNTIGVNGNFRHAIQISNVHTSKLTVKYIESYNEPGKSRTEDTFNMYNCGGIDANNKMIAKGFFLKGSYHASGDSQFTGAALSADGSGDSSELHSQFIDLQDAWLVSNEGAAANIATGHDISFSNLYAVTTGYLPDNSLLGFCYRGFWIGDYYHLGAGSNNTMSGITSMFMRTKDVSAPRRSDFIADSNDPNDTINPGIDASHATLLPTPSSIADGLTLENNAFLLWRNYLNTNNQTVGY